MRLSRTVFDILSPIFQKLQSGRAPKNFSVRKLDRTRFPGLSRGVVCVILRLAVLIQYRRVTDTHTDMQTRDHGYYPRRASSTRVKILVLSHRLGDLGVTHRVHLWLDGKRIVDFPLVIIELSSLALTAAALLCEICRNWRFLKWWVILSANFR